MGSTGETSVVGNEHNLRKIACQIPPQNLHHLRMFVLVFDTDDVAALASVPTMTRNLLPGGRLQTGRLRSQEQDTCSCGRQIQLLEMQQQASIVRLLSL